MIGGVCIYGMVSYDALFSDPDSCVHVIHQGHPVVASSHNVVHLAFLTIFYANQDTENDITGC